MKTNEFISKFNDEEVIQRMTSVKTPEEAHAVAKEYGVTDSLEEFVEEMTKFKTAIDELSEEDLEAVAGGLSPEAIITIATATAATAGAVSGVSIGSVVATAVTGMVAVTGAVSATAASVGATLGVSVGLTAAGAAASAAV
jgi:hypothetical protein